ncbi:MAG: protein-L-isoaspartate(D-aspartate) O-methyltransferase [Gammaproteobacteria bacterium]|jgi:protein-L-isoaspartate(D-aspartate) O-methyltransferase|nr:protein-L-isoaspartate(D-aspartate) O-methyltransferase [Gammaproteobacteria bacterium]
MPRPFLLPALLCLLMAQMACTDTFADAYARERQRLMTAIADLATETLSETGRPAFSAAVMAALTKVPRHRFVPADQVPYAYDNRPLAIGHGQTISQPYIVALMTDLIDPRTDQTVLEIGTGSGYQAAVLAELVAQVYSIEIIAPLATEAANRIRELGYANIQTRTGDGYYGWEEAGPFDAILVTAAASHVPPPLIRQLKPGGRMVIPVGAHFMAQYLLLVEKDEDGQVSTRQILPVSFVPLTGGGKD